MESLSTFLTRNVDPVYAAVVSGAVFLAAATKYGPQMLVSTNSETGTLVKAEHSFEDGVIQPHRQYLYGYSTAGEHYIVGKKVAGHDYSAWEGNYENFKRIRSVTFADSGAKITWSWSVKAPEAFTASNILQLVCWLVLAAVCAFILGYLTCRVVDKLCHKNSNGKKESLVTPDADINAEHLRLNFIWQRTLINLYQEQKRELLSLSKLAVYYYDSSRELKKALAKESKKKGEVKLKTERLEAEHAFQIEQYQSEIEALRSELESANIAKDHAEASLKEQDERSLVSHNESTGPGLGDKISDEEHGIVDVPDTGDENAESITQQDDKSPVADDQSAAPGLADNFSEAADVVDPEEKFVENTQDEHSSAPHNQSASSEIRDKASEGDHGMAEAAYQGDKNVEGTTEQTANNSSSVDQVDGVRLGASGKPLRMRKNRRADGTVRTPYHPEYVPRVPDGPALGDRPAPGAGRGNGNGGGNGPARGRGGYRGYGGDGGDRGGHFGWRGGRGGGGGRGWQGNGGGRGQFGQGRGG